MQMGGASSSRGSPAKPWVRRSRRYAGLPAAGEWSSSQDGEVRGGGRNANNNDL